MSSAFANQTTSMSLSCIGSVRENAHAINSCVGVARHVRPENGAFNLRQKNSYKHAAATVAVVVAAKLLDVR